MILILLIFSFFSTKSNNNIINLQNIDDVKTCGEGNILKIYSDEKGKSAIVSYLSISALDNNLLKNSKSLHPYVDFASGQPVNYSLFSEGKSNYRISLSPKASDSEHWVARELQYWLKEISGIEIPIDLLNKSYSGPQIVLGYNSFIAQKTGKKEPAESDESFRYFNSGSNIYIYGGKKRGTMYGVFSFLERELGCRWYTPTVSVIPKRKELKFYKYDHSEKPGILIRCNLYFEANDPNWAVRNRLNAENGEKNRPGGEVSYWGVHTFYKLMPPADFFDKHPEYYSLINGKRIPEHAQLCLSNPDVLRIMTERIKKRMRESPEFLVYDVSQNDWTNPCQCEKCQAIVKKLGSESGIIIWFVNQVAESVKKEYPDKFIGTLAYLYTRIPPKNIIPRENVVVRLCSYECCFAHNLKNCPQNKSFLSDLQRWSAIAPHLYIWDYVVNFSDYLIPYPNFRVLQPNIKTYRGNNVTSILEEADFQSRGGDFSELRSYLISKLLWNPDCNTEEVINDFISGYYGKSGKYIRQYFDLVQNLITPNVHIHIGLSTLDPLFSDDFIRQSSDLFRQAEKIADNDKILHRVEMTSLGILYLKCMRTPVIAKKDGSYEKFCRVSEREGITHYNSAGESQKKDFHKRVKDSK
jgi:hypothetical protein